MNPPWIPLNIKNGHHLFWGRLQSGLCYFCHFPLFSAWARVRGHSGSHQRFGPRCCVSNLERLGIQKSASHLRSLASRLSAGDRNLTSLLASVSHMSHICHASTSHVKSYKFTTLSWYSTLYNVKLLVLALNRQDSTVKFILI